MGTFGLALGAGGARGIAHIHALKALDDLGVKPEILAGTSIGAIIGSAYCSGMSGQEIEDYLVEKFDNPLRLLGEAMRIRPDSFEDFLRDGGLRIGEINLERILDAFLPDQVAECFEAFEIPIIAVATDYYAAEAKLFDAGPVKPALAASAAIPAVFLPVKVGERYYTDGSATNPCPFDVLQGKADHLIAIDVSGGPLGTPTKRPRKIDAIYATSQLMQQSIVKYMLEHSPVAALLRPPVDRFRVLDFLETKAVLEETASLYEDVKRAVSQILQAS
ncbi:MAG: patatin-like phospholipase family protein [Pseudomonadota bacterium]